MNPNIRWPMTDSHPSWCSGWFCAQTRLGRTHHSDPITLQLDDGRWQLSWQRADEPGEGETQLSIITSDPASNAPMIEHILSQHDIHKIREALGLMGEQAGAEAGTMLEAVR